jgi:serine acetyltransferase/glycosyltransferase involved in cell wall biosynthesis
MAFGREAGMTPEVSVVVATYNRPDGIISLLGDLDRQEGFAAGGFEVIVVDDGSREPIAPRIAELTVGYPLQVIAQENAGQAAARHRGLSLARGEIVVIIDDDMRFGPRFLDAHRAAIHAGADVVQGAIVPPDYTLPLFERWHATELVRFAASIAAGQAHVRGAHLATGNVSLRRRLYNDVGGFDPQLKRSEDRDLGIRLERWGARFAFSADAFTIHNTDHVSLDVWLRRAFNYGIFDSQIADKYPDVEYVDPWGFLFGVNPISRPLLLLSASIPPLGAVIARVAMAAATLSDRMKLPRVALAGSAFVYGMTYYRGVRKAAGSLLGTYRGLGRYMVKRSREKLRAGRAGPMAAWSDFRRVTRIDFAVMTEGRAKYLGETHRRRWLADVITNIGFQMVFAIRVMRLFRDSGLRLFARIACRMIRHAYAAEIHWDAEFAPGLNIVHGNGLVVSHAAKVGEGCVLFHNVTLGMGIAADTGEMGAPVLERTVHVGPGATLLGPVVLGEGTKVMAGAVLNRSVPTNSLVRPAEAEIIPRSGRRVGRANSVGGGHDSAPLEIVKH